jgi:hypothetical protein
VDLIISNFAGIVSLGTNDLLSVERLRNEIETNGRPVVIRWGWSTSGGHILVLHGILVTNRPTRYTNVWLMDPLNGPVIQSYDWTCQGSTNGGATHTWTHSLPISTAPPALQVAPLRLDFGRVEVGTSVTQQVVLDNVGSGWVTGTSSVATPFGIVSATTYHIPGYSSVLGSVRYSPAAPGTNTQTVSFTGGGGASCIATGTASLFLEEALDAPYLSFFTVNTSTPFWKRDTATTHDDEDAAKAGPLSTAGSAIAFSTTVTGPGAVSFWRKVSGSGFLFFLVGGVSQMAMGVQDWNQYAAVVPSGSQALEWVYYRDSGDPWGGIGWVDQVTYGPAVVVAWGANGIGQTKVPAGLTNIVGLAAGSMASLVLKDDQTITGWETAYSFYGGPPAGLTNVVALVSGDSHVLALRSDGSVVAWGYNYYGQTNVPAGLTNVVAVAGGIGHSLTLSGDGTVVAWGDNTSGQTNVPAGLTNVVAIAAGQNLSLALKQDGTVVAWGQNFFGQTNVPAGLSNVVAIATGGGHCIALKSDGHVLAWGDSTYGQTNIPAGLTNAVAIAAGTSHSLILKADGTVVGWGANGNGQTNVPAWLTKVVAIAAGANHNLALMSGESPAGTLCLTNLDWHTNRFAAWVPTARGKSYFLEYKTSLADSRWIMRPPVPGNGAARQLTDPSATTTQRFYRVRQQ